MKLDELKQYYGRKGKYVEPSAFEIEVLKELTRFLVLDQSPLAMSYIEFLASKLGLKMVELDEKPNNYAFFNDQNESGLFFIWNFNKMHTVKKTLKKDLEVVSKEVEKDEEEEDEEPEFCEEVCEVDEDDEVLVKIDDKFASPSILAYPHSGSDNVDSFVINNFLAGSHKALVINGWSIASTDKRSTTQVAKTKCNSDHSFDNLMCYFINFINLKMPEVVFINFHGATTKPDRDLWAINSMSSYNTKIRNYAILFSIVVVTKSKLKLQTSFNFKEFTFKGKPVNVVGFERSGPTTSVIGKIIHSQSMNPKSKVKDTGNYLHSEHSISFANKTKNANEVSRLHQISLQYYLIWDSAIHDLSKAPKELAEFESWILNI